MAVVAEAAAATAVGCRRVGLAGMVPITRGVFNVTATAVCCRRTRRRKRTPPRRTGWN